MQKLCPKMFFQHRRFASFFLLFSVLEHVSSILDADYYIQSLENPRLCIEGGAPRRNLTESKGIFHEGMLGTKVCRNVLEQQWHFVKIGPLGQDHALYNISSAAPEIYISGSLKAKIAGYFMKYWHNPVELIPRGKEEARGGLFLIKELGQDACFENSGEGKVLKTSHCDFNSRKQTWRLRLVTRGVV